jgi:putative transposase
LTRVLGALGIASSVWYWREKAGREPGRRGPKAKEIAVEVKEFVVEMCRMNPWYGYKRIAAMCRRWGCGVRNREVYRVMKEHDLLQRRKRRKGEVHQALKLWELLPQGVNELWQMDVTYVHIPGYGWWYAMTVIDYYSRYLLSVHLAPSYCAQEVIEALGAARREAERVHGRLERNPILLTDNGPSFISRRFGRYVGEGYGHVRIAYRTPTQLGLLERFHRTLKEEEIYWRLYESSAHGKECLVEFRHRYNTERPHWALIPPGGGDPLTPEEVYVAGCATELPRWQGWARKAKAKLERLQGEAA